jgi:hypothetical protein
VHSSVEWADVLKWEEIIYHHDETKTGEITEQELGEYLGKVMFRVMFSEEEDNPDYQLKNQEAAWLDEGTKVHAISGEPSTDYVFADGKVYKAEE